MKRRLKHLFRRSAGFAPPRVRGQRESYSADSYDILSPGKRLTPEIEIEAPDEMLSKQEDNEIVAIVRDQERNDSNIKGWIKSILLHTIGTGQKPVFKNFKNVKDENRGPKYYFQKLTSDWDAFTGKHRVECARSVLKTCILEGEILVFFDHTGLINKGRFCYFRRDRMPEIKDWKSVKDKVAKEFDVPPVKNDDGDDYYRIYQNKGVITNEKGVVLGYVIGSKVGQEEEDIKNVTLLPLKNYKVKLITMDAEVGGIHGFSQLLSCSGDVKDVKSLHKSNITKARNQAKFGLAFKVRDSLRKGLSRSQGQDGSAGDTRTEMKKSRNEYNPDRKLTRMEKFGSDGETLIEYLEPEESIETVGLSQGDAIEVDKAAKGISLPAAYALGLTRLYATGDASHGQFASLMAENNISRSFFAYLQKWLERELYDFEIECLIFYWEKLELIKEVDDSSVKWQGYPIIKSLNPLQDIKAKKEGWKSGVELPDIEDLEAHIKTLTDLAKAYREGNIPSDIYNPQYEEEVIDDDEGEGTASNELKKEREKQ